MADYIKERSSGDIIRDSVKIYRDYFRTIVAIYFFNSFFWSFLYDILTITDSWPRGRWAVYVLGCLMPFLSGVQLITVIVQIYHGYELNPVRLFRRPQIFGKALLTGLLIIVPPLIILYPWIMLAVPVSVVERTWGSKALLRSLRLGRHYYLRNFAIFGLPYLLYFLIWLIYGFVTVGFGPFGLSSRTLLLAIKGAAFSLIEPVVIVSTVLVYFDMRIRNEAYDIVSLSEELQK